jgi:hypothetical protein
MIGAPTRSPVPSFMTSEATGGRGHTAPALRRQLHHLRATAGGEKAHALRTNHLGAECLTLWVVAGQKFSSSTLRWMGS